MVFALLRYSARFVATVRGPSKSDTCIRGYLYLACALALAKINEEDQEVEIKNE